MVPTANGLYQTLVAAAVPPLLFAPLNTKLVCVGQAEPRRRHCLPAETAGMSDKATCPLIKSSVSFLVRRNEKRLMSHCGPMEKIRLDGH